MSKSFRKNSSKKSSIEEFFDSWPYIAAIINADGNITHVNEKWKKNLLTNDGSIEKCGPGVNYLEVALKAAKDSEPGKEKAREAAAGIKAVLSGRKEIYQQRYSFCKNRREKWFEMKVKPFQEGALIIHEEITELKQTGKELKLAKFSLDNADMMVLRITPDGEINYVNNKTINKLGYRRDKLLGLPVKELLPDNQEIIEPQILMKKVKQKGSITREDEIRTKEGQKFPVNVVIQHFQYEKEKYYYIFASDISAKKEMEEKLNLTQFSVDNAAIGIYQITPGGKIEYVNEKVGEMLGYSRGELIGKRVADIDPDFNSDRREQRWREIKREKVSEIETRHRTKDGKVFPARVTSKYLQYRDKEYEFAFVRDISQEKMEKQKAEALFANSTSAIAKLDSRGNIININKEFQEVFGYSLPEVRGENLDDVMEWGQKGYSNREKTARFLSGERLTGKGTRYDRWGNPKEFVFHGIPIDIGGEIEGAYAMYDDITELKVEKEKLEAIFTASQNVAFVITEPDQKNNGAQIKEFSPGAENIFGYDREEIVDEQVSRLLAPETENQIADMIENINKGESWSSKVKLQRKNGKPFTALLNVYPFFGPHETNRALGVAIDISELEKTREKLQYLSYHDDLTGLYNRKFMEENMERLDTERQLPLSLVMLDINGLKIINDTFGHAMGDKLLKRTAEILQDSIRQEDILARWAGDEFVIMLPQTTAKEAEEILARIDNKCRQSYRQSCDKDLSKDPPISLGKGVATKIDPGEKLEEVLNRADKKMYEDKRKNGNTAKREMINCLLQRLYKNSYETERHSLRVGRLAMKLGEKLDLPDKSLEDLAYLGSLHDIGEVAIDRGILQKQGKLREDEWKKIKRHPGKGAKLVSPVGELNHLANIINYHHERWDGKGYPEGKTASNIPLLARIFAICDAYEVMTAGRPYKQAMSREEALEEIKNCAGSQFDPELAAEFIEMIKNRKEQK